MVYFWYEELCSFTYKTRNHIVSYHRNAQTPDIRSNVKTLTSRWWVYSLGLKENIVQNDKHTVYTNHMQHKYEQTAPCSKAPKFVILMNLCLYDWSNAPKQQSWEFVLVYCILARQTGLSISSLQQMNNFLWSVWAISCLKLLSVNTRIYFTLNIFISESKGLDGHLVLRLNIKHRIGY